MRRCLLNLLTLASLVLCVVVAALWVRSYTRAEHFWLIYREGGGDLFRSDRGDFTVYRSTSNERDMRATGVVRFEYAAGPLVGSHARPGSYPITRRWGPFSYAAVPPPAPPSPQRVEEARRVLRESGQSPKRETDPRDRLRMQLAQSVLSGDSNRSHWSFVFPAWSLCVVTLILPLFTGLQLVRRRHAARRVKQGFCASCGYNLAGNVSGVCPECGEGAIRR